MQSMRDAVHEMAVEEQHRVPLVQRAIEAIGFDRLEFDRVAIEIQALGILAFAEDRRGDTPKRPVLGDEGVGPVDVKDRRDDHDLVVEQVLVAPEEELAGDYVERFGGLRLRRVDVAEEEHDRFPGRFGLLGRGDPRVTQHDRRGRMAARADEHGDDVHELASGLEDGDELQQIGRGHRALVVRPLGNRRQLGGPVPVPVGGHLITPVDLLLRHHGS